ncbi:MAG: M15 family metallopeptidase [Treponema sp.]|nr:M15 family metallopeptidase [Treponema sp.]
MSLKKLFYIFSIPLLLCGCSKQSLQQSESDISQSNQIEENSPEEIPTSLPARPALLSIFEQSYPDISFDCQFDSDANDFKITMTLENQQSVFYWNNGSMLPLEELENKEKYWTLLYNYNYNQPLPDPADYTEEQIAALKNFSSTENRKNGAGTPMFFFDAVYNSYTKADLEKNIIQIKFLGFKVNVHKRLEEPLSKVEKRIMDATETDSEVANFVKSINKNEGYYWRLIANTNRKSFHSLGIAIDIQPKSYKGKEVYWSWAKDRNPDGWMFTPLKDRWMPPQTVIDIFEDEGFIWGGKWVIWDNMHFEYHPELINNAKARKILYN